ncbi:hypothetical protein AKJ63_00600 [candidate division MSBL1 archaeon SCGC-AAA259D18]|uniref:Polymerase nucleotidyl transferase domain-containing protein n=2 Tax=candidate division MSBL1 TaxID=215777 RepID=A0A133U9R0_9EURY|nr:hypothetical protein AKJ57_03150 [candidate division MSBL1 archaeon SCGC-AAA259A05]KXA91868.1 hypothetical protein AKJ63_00600 [candidate division MSBL1 archaeon SCGC-AAA259D18]
MVQPRKTVSRERIVYSEEDWQRFKKFREDAKKVLKALQDFNLRGLAHGSIARGDLKKNSDIDIIIPETVPSYRVELALQEGGNEEFGGKIVMATPWQLPKAHISISSNVTVTFPLEKPKEVEEEFYQFGGAVSLKQVEKKERVPGVDKRLVLIEPTKNGHKESQVIGKEGEVAKQLDVSIDIVQERIDVLTRRNQIGRTGIFLEREVPPDESFESMWKKVRERNPKITREY